MKKQIDVLTRMPAGNEASTMLVGAERATS